MARSGTNEHSAIGCQLRPGTGQQAGVGGNADGYHAKVTGVGAAVGLHLLHEGTARERAHLLAQIELHALRFQLLLDQLAHLRVKLGQKLLLFFNDTHIAAQLEEGLCDLQTGPAAAQDHDVPHIGGADELLEEDQIFHGLEGLHAHAVTAGHLRHTVGRTGGQHQLVVVVFKHASGGKITYRHLAGGCVDAAHLMAQMCGDALRVQLSLLGLNGLVQAVQILAQVMGQAAGAAGVEAAFFVDGDLRSALGGGKSGRRPKPRAAMLPMIIIFIV